MTIFGSMIAMIALNIFIIAWELFRRSKGDFVDLDGPEPEIPQFNTKKEKKDIVVPEGEESDTEKKKKDNHLNET